MTPLISIIIPTFRRRESLLILLRALKQQTLSDREVIVVDQNPTGYFGDSLQSADLEPVLHHRLEKPNCSSARNFGFSKARGKFVLFLDDDCVPEPTFCARVVETFEKHAAVKCFVPVVYTQKGQEDGLSDFDRVMTGRALPDSLLRELSEATTVALFIERDYFRQTGGFDELLFEFARAGEDQEFFFRLRRRELCLWLDTSLYLFHDETQPGGCELRTTPYWEARERSVRSWALRYRIHRGGAGKLTGADVYRLCRSCFLNRIILTPKLTDTARQIKIMVDAIHESGLALQPHLEKYADFARVDHLKKYR